MPRPCRAGADIFVTKTHSDLPEHEHFTLAIKDAFAAAQRQIEDAVREMRGQVKPHEAGEHGHVSKFVAGDDYDLPKPPMAARSIFI
jgi:hypothetical protein